MSFSPHAGQIFSFAGAAAVQIWQMRLPSSSGLESTRKSLCTTKWYCLRVTGWWCHPMHRQQSQCTRELSSMVSSYTRSTASCSVPLPSVTVCPSTPLSTK